jgi:hypothetical protein
MHTHKCVNVLYYPTSRMFSRRIGTHKNQTIMINIICTIVCVYDLFQENYMFIKSMLSGVDGDDDASCTAQLPIMFFL